MHAAGAVSHTWLEKAIPEVSGVIDSSLLVYLFFNRNLNTARPKSTGREANSLFSNKYKLQSSSCSSSKLQRQ